MPWKYAVYQRDTLALLELAIEEAREQGWDYVGGVNTATNSSGHISHFKTYYLQAMTRKEK